ncbi:MAG: T9SS type A sorting domain-containing protein [Porphyromonadaceae bacterium]|nr:T9SS type A sorting domain-containing protein [Porphyromonadaceae bacterium]
MKKHLLRNLIGIFVLIIAFNFRATAADVDVTSTYLSNPGFDISCNYLFDAPAEDLKSANGGANIKTVESWTIGDKGDNSAAASYEYGYTGTLNASGEYGKIPATGPDGITSGSGHGALGISTAWTGTVTYYQNVTLPAGTYKIKYAAKNTGPNVTDYSRVGWVPTTGTSVLSTRTSFPMGEWIEDVITFTLTTETSGKIQVGLNAPNVGSGSVGRIFFDYIQLLQVNDPILNVNKTSLTFNAANRIESFVVTGSNLTTDITLTAPTGITLDKTTLTVAEAQAGVTVTATSDGSTAITDGEIILSSSGAENKVITVNVDNAEFDCFNPLYTDRPNLIPDPLLNSLNGFGGWGWKSITNVVGEPFCGNGAVKFDAQTNSYPEGAALDVNLTWKPNTTYRVKAMVKTVDGSVVLFAKGTSPDFLYVIPQSNDEWVEVDKIINTGSSAGNGFLSINNVDGNATGKVVFIDNYELYELFDAPNVLLDKSNIVVDMLKGTETFVVTGVNLISDVTLIAPDGISLDKTTITAAEAIAGTTVTATYDGTVEINAGAIVVSSMGAVDKEITVDAKPDGATSAIINPSFEANQGDRVQDILGWTKTGPANSEFCTRNDAGPLAGAFKTGNVYFQYWSSDKPDYSVSQVITGLPNGRYLLSADAGGDVETKGTFVFANDKQVEVTSTGSTYSVETAVVDGTLTFGFKSVNRTVNWSFADNFKLTVLPSIVAVGNAGANLDSVYFDRANRTASVIVSTLLVNEGLKLSTTNPAFSVTPATLPNTGGEVSITVSGNEDLEGDLKVTLAQPINGINGMQKAKVGDPTTFSIPLKALLAVTNVRDLLIENNKTIIERDNIISSFNLVKSSVVKMELFNVNGMRIDDHSALLNAGSNQLIIKRNLISGVYFVRISIDGNSYTQKVVK